MLNVLVTGRQGRMGQAVIAAVANNANTQLHATHDMGQDLSQQLDGVNVIIDFSHHTFTRELLEQALQRNIPVVIGTTGHTPEERAFIEQCSAQLPIVFAPNFSIGVNTLFWLTRQATRILGESFDIEVTEMHHKHKIDAPSGTANRILGILCEESGLDIDKDVAHGRLGNIGPRPARQIGMHTLRGGDVIGDHSIIYSAEGEQVTLSHHASSRMTFAGGAVHSAVWLCKQPKGMYNMEDVLGLSQR